MDTKYYRLLESLEENWEPFWQDPESGRRMEFHSHLDALFASAPEKGDYLVLGVDGELSPLCPTSYEKYRGVKFDNMASLDSLLIAGVVVEVPADVRMLDWQLQARIEALEGAIDELKEKLEELAPKMNERRFLFLTPEARDCQHIYNELKPMLDGLCQELREVRGEMEEKVVKPLAERVHEQQEHLHASIDDLIFGASSRGTAVLDLKKSFNIEHNLEF